MHDSNHNNLHTDGGTADAFPPGIVRDLQSLIGAGCEFPTIYADPPWKYSNTAARGAADNHYRTMTLQDICAEPIRQLAGEVAHLHLWTTNAFLRDAFEVIEAWGFTYKSCLIWIKPQLGMGNYWRVSHEYLLLGVRGAMPFHDKSCRSWVLERRTAHSRKPHRVRELIERVSPGPYLELYGREEIPRSQWTVYGNQVERRLF
jgi:N6-adenosine-specific RNA methylase IME4